jgi:hypothetical protein
VAIFFFAGFRLAFTLGTTLRDRTGFEKFMRTNRIVYNEWCGCEEGGKHNFANNNISLQVSMLIDTVCGNAKAVDNY